MNKNLYDCIEYDESFNEVLEDYAQDEEIRHELDDEFDKVLEEHAQDEEVKYEVDKDFDDVLNKSAAEVLTLEEMLEIDPNYVAQPLETDEEFDTVLELVKGYTEEEYQKNNPEEVSETDNEFEEILEEIAEDEKIKQIEITANAVSNKFNVFIAIDLYRLIILL